MDRRRHVRSLRKADCDNDRYLVTAKLGERLLVRERLPIKFGMKRFISGRLIMQYRVKIQGFASLNNFDGNVNTTEITKMQREQHNFCQRGNALRWSDIHKVVNCVYNKDEFGKAAGRMLILNAYTRRMIE